MPRTLGAHGNEAGDAVLLLFFVRGEASAGLEDDVEDTQPGTWIHMSANLKHSSGTKTPAVMLLVLLESE